MRKWRGNRERMRKLREIHSLHFLSISSHPFPISKFVSFCCKMLNTAVLSQISQKNLTYMRYEKIILGCEKASQVVRACQLVMLHV